MEPPAGRLVSLAVGPAHSPPAPLLEAADTFPSSPLFRLSSSQFGELDQKYKLSDHTTKTIEITREKASEAGQAIGKVHLGSA